MPVLQLELIDPHFYGLYLSEVQRRSNQIEHHVNSRRIELPVIKKNFINLHGYQTTIEVWGFRAPSTPPYQEVGKFYRLFRFF